MTPLDHPCFSALVHLFTVESLPLYIFYFTFLDVLTAFWAFCYMWNIEAQMIKPGHFNFCVLNDMWWAILYLTTDYQGECVDLQGTNYGGWTHLGCVVICAGSMIYLSAKTLSRGGSDVCSGKFLASEWDAQESPIYSRIAMVMGIYTLAAILWTFHQGHFWSRGKGEMLVAFLFYRAAPLGILVFNAFYLTTRKLPEFDYDDEEFETFRFHRSWGDLLLQPLSVFTEKLEKAILIAHTGNMAPLEDMLENPEQAKDVLRVCTFEDCSLPQHENISMRMKHLIS
eukprot:gb/GFBE01051958.1/.p1 GENE.gb/GFBE01051958.1/~~gb/GFBE01051958.1/.p1  ORF type:complete len:284 (+),score=43.26 gb/GFBE01051958.1/:1-852(+)